MTTFASHHGLQPGDVVITPKSAFEIIDHYIVFIKTTYDGTDIYSENKIHYGVILINGDRFIKENPTYNAIRRFIGDPYQRKLAVNRALSLIGKKYHLTKFNCENYANFVQYNKSFSKQASRGVGFAALLVGALVIGSANSKR